MRAGCPLSEIFKDMLKEWSKMVIQTSTGTPKAFSTWRFVNWPLHYQPNPSVDFLASLSSNFPLFAVKTYHVLLPTTSYIHQNSVGVKISVLTLVSLPYPLPKEKEKKMDCKWNQKTSSSTFRSLPLSIMTIVFASLQSFFNGSFRSGCNLSSISLNWSILRPWVSTGSVRVALKPWGCIPEQTIIEVIK